MKQCVCEKIGRACTSAKETKERTATMADHEDTLASFMGITGASSTTATQYLEITNWILEEAVNLFMESGGQGVGGADGPPPAPSSAAAASAYDDDVRAPDPSKRQRLFGDTFDSAPIRRLHEQYRDFAAESIAAINAASRTPVISSAFGPGTDESEDGNRSRDLSSLFQPPVDLMFTGTYSEARALAKSSGKWLLVNIQDEIVFASHMLNRDTWADDVVQNVVASGYVFWQHYWVSEHGKKFCTLYQIDRDTLPVIAIVNPKTGEIVQKYSGFVEPHVLTERLSDFSFSNGFEEDTASVSANQAASNERDITEASEDEQLAAAIAASMEGADDGQSGEDFDENEDKADTPEVIHEPLPEEPAEGTPDVTRVQIRAPDGSRLTRRFLKSDPISLLWRFIKDQVPEARTRDFELRTAFPPAALAFHEHDTIAERKLENASLMVKWL